MHRSIRTGLLRKTIFTILPYYKDQFKGEPKNAYDNISLSSSYNKQVSGKKL
jgi:hypothetical protein